MRTILVLAVLGGLVWSDGLLAQQQQQLPATTVQLPSFSIFSVNTTVSVPDSGGMYLGGVNRARDSSTTRGLRASAQPRPRRRPAGQRRERARHDHRLERD